MVWAGRRLFQSSRRRRARVPASPRYFRRELEPGFPRLAAITTGKDLIYSRFGNNRVRAAGRRHENMPQVPSSPVRLKDIAKELNVSVMTVSKVVRECADVGAETRGRVLAKIKEMNYQPNWVARSLAA